MKKQILTLLAAALLSGCGLTTARIRPGNIVSHLSSGATVSQVQPQDPKEKTSLDQHSEKTVKLTLPPGSEFIMDAGLFSSVAAVTNQVPGIAHVLVSPTGTATFESSTKDNVTSSLGAAQANTLADTIAKLHSLSWLTWLGAILVLGGLACFFYPPLALLVPKNCAIAAAACGAAFIVLPTLLVGHELLILGIGGAALIVYYLAHHMGAVTSELSTLKTTLFPAAPAAVTPEAPAAPAASAPVATSPAAA